MNEGEGFYWIVLFGLLVFFGILAVGLYMFDKLLKYRKEILELELKEKQVKPKETRKP